ncbi:MAG: thioredoxin-disulfide reductase [Firmicutes bacterium HGW-Firmicutes-9]|jgi:thioredoxin reductase (NADPH)|nr:MAG: thioredoxin-disulfide reductase [Firmicutes bacterium HGW-Firmicutes-9]
MHSDIAIIGGGPAGLTAGLYAARGGASVTLYEELFPGGQIAKTPLVENYPGFPDGVVGYEVGSLIQKQAEKFGLKVEYAGATGLVLCEDPKRILLPDREDTAKTVILCMGAHARSLGIPREEELVGAGVSYCATCDGAFFKEKDVVVVGGGDTAVSDALYLSRFCTNVTIVHRRDEFRAAAVLVEKAKQTENIHMALSCVPVSFAGESHVEGLEIRDLKTGQTRVVPASGVFVAVGITPQSDLVKNIVILNESGSIVTDELMKTNLPGVYAAGDIRNTPLRQVITACADGAVAATSALEFISCH